VSARKLAESIRTLPPAARVLFTSGFTEPDFRQPSLLEEGAAFVEKPFRLAKRVRAAVDGEEGEVGP
jgi:hypothetical protein